MASEDLPMRMLVGIIVLLIILFIYSWFYKPETLLAATHANLTQNVSIRITNERLTNSILGPVTIPRPDVLGSTYIYKVTASPQMKITGERKWSELVFAVITFKDQNAIATTNINGLKTETFTITPDDTVLTKDFTAELTTGIQPITDRGNPYPGYMTPETPILLKTDTGAVAVSLFRIERTKKILNRFLPDFINNIAFDCRAELKFDCLGGTRYSNFLTECKTGKECQDTFDVCGGTADISVSDFDCINRRITGEIRYEGGKYQAGETVLISFWRYSDCTKKTIDLSTLPAQCPQDSLGGYTPLNAGIIQP